MESNITDLLFAWRAGDREASDRLFVVIQRELRKAAHSALRQGNANGLLQTTALVNEAYLRLARGPQVDWRDRSHFFAVASTVMRNIVVDYLRGESTGKRGGGMQRVELGNDPVTVIPLDPKLLELDDALNRLATQDERKRKVVEMRFFVGMSNEEIAEALQCSLATVKRDWTVARAWLLREINKE